jgi:hypothetical protein
MAKSAKNLSLSLRKAETKGVSVIKRYREQRFAGLLVSDFLLLWRELDTMGCQFKACGSRLERLRT